MIKINLEPHQKLWFTSDTHYHHTNICRGTSRWDDKTFTRNYDTIERMNHAIVTGINSNVMQDDILIHLGDWSFGGFDKIKEFRDKIWCKNIYLILGNHDHHIERDRDGISGLFTEVHHYAMLEVKYTNHSNVSSVFNAVLMHYPIASWHNMKDGVYHLHGHVHLPPVQKVAEGRAMDVGLDGNSQFSPYEMKNVDNLLKNRPIKKLSLPKDHHERL